MSYYFVQHKSSTQEIKGQNKNCSTAVDCSSFGQEVMDSPPVRCLALLFGF